MTDARVTATRALALCAAVLCVLASSRLEAAPATAHLIPIQGVVRDADDVLLPSGNVAVRIYADSLGLSPLYDSGSEFNGAIAQGIFDIVVGKVAPLMLDHEQSYFLELNTGGAEVIGDAAGGRWRFYAGGGSRARTDLEARLDSLENAMGLAPASLRTAGGTPIAPARSATALANPHGMLGLGRAAASAGGYNVTANLLATPIGSLTSGGVQTQLGPYYLFAPFPNPIIEFVHDVPGDQGRAVRVRWSNDLRERAYNASDTQARITSYTLYRRVGPGQAAARTTVPSTGATSPAAQTPTLFSMERATAPIQPTTLPPGEWDVLATVPATLDSAYQTVVPTLCDSTPAGICWSTFLIRAITDRVGTYHNSGADSGYSTDNLAPGVPAGLTATPGSGGTQLSWQPSAAPDFQYFRVYRGTDPSFVPGPGSFVHATATTQWIDPLHGSFTYKLTAVDFNGNESPAASTSIVVGVDPVAPRALAFASVAPNPFRHSLTFVIDIPEKSGMIDLTVFDLAGRRVRNLASGALQAGRHTFTWDGRAQEGGRAAPGIYVARLSSPHQSLTRRTTLLP